MGSGLTNGHLSERKGGIRFDKSPSGAA